MSFVLQRQQSFFSRLNRFWAFGFLCIIISGIFGAGYHIISKVLTKPLDENVEIVHALQLVVIRQATILATSYPLAVWKQYQFRGITPSQWVFLGLRSASALVGAWLAQFAIQRVPLSDFSTIAAMTPVLTTLVAWPILREKPLITDLPLFLACFLGTILIVQPEFIFSQSESYKPPDFVGVLLSFGFVVASVVLQLSLRKLRQMPSAVISSLYGLITTAVALIVYCVIVQQLPPCSTLLRLLATVSGSSAALAVFAATVASKVLPPGFVALTPVVEIVVFLIWQVAYERKQPSLFSLLGASVVVVAFSYYGLRTYLIHNVKQSALPHHEQPLYIRLLIA